MLSMMSGAAQRVMNGRKQEHRSWIPWASIQNELIWTACVCSMCSVSTWQSLLQHGCSDNWRDTFLLKCTGPSSNRPGLPTQWPHFHRPHLTKWHKGRRSTLCSDVTPAVLGQTLQGNRRYYSVAQHKHNHWKGKGKENKTAIHACQCLN